MTDDQSRPWLPSATSECPVDLDKQRWVESSLRWFTDEFGTAVLSRDALSRDDLSPDADFLGKSRSTSREQVDQLVARLCELMMVDPESVSVELADGPATGTKAKSPVPAATAHFVMRDGRAVIAFGRGESNDPRLLTAIAVHELCHVRLLGEGRIDRDRPDGERLTDLLAVFFGFGLFSTNAAMGALNAGRNEGHQRMGYLSSTEWGYALACYCWLRREKEPAWARHLDPGPRVYLEQGLAYLSRTSAAGELPTQRLLNKSVKIGDVTVRVTRGAILGPASFGLTQPDR